MDVRTNGMDARVRQSLRQDKKVTVDRAVLAAYIAELGEMNLLALMRMTLDALDKKRLPQRTPKRF